jgi:hypothetical protein
MIYPPAPLRSEAVKRITLNDLIVALTLVNLGQQLGTDSPAARAVFDLATLLTSFFRLVS